MKTKTYISVILLFIGLTINAQNKKANPLEGVPKATFAQEIFKKLSI